MIDKNHIICLAYKNGRTQFKLTVLKCADYKTITIQVHCSRWYYCLRTYRQAQTYVMYDTAVKSATLSVIHDYYDQCQ